MKGMELEKKPLIECLESLGRGQSPTYVEEESGIFAINQKCVRNGAVDALHSRPHDQKIRVKDSALLQDGDVCINSTGTGTIGRVGLWSAKGLHNGTRYFADSHVTIARPNKDIVNPKYLAALLESSSVQMAMETYCFSGSTNQVELNRTALESLELDLIQKEAQDEVATILSTLDRAIEQTEAIIAKQQRVKTGLMQDLLTKGIDENGVIRSEATHEFKDSPLGRIPAEWEIEPLGKVTSLVTSGSRGWARFYSTEGAVFLRIGNLTREHINFRFDDVMYVNVPGSSEGKRTAVQDGDLLISITADLGIIAIVPEGFPEAYVNQHIALVRLNKDEVFPRFIGHLLNGDVGQTQIEKLNESGAKAGLNLPTIENLMVFKPKYSEQQKIVDILDGVDSQIAIDKKRVDKLRHQKAGLMYDLLTGTVRVESGRADE
jgi:type I restriction enzyme, S subunit